MTPSQKGGAPPVAGTGGSAGVMAATLDGVAVPGSPQSIGSVTLGNDSTPVTVGAEDENGTFAGWADMIHDELRIYNRSISAPEVKLLSQ